MNTGPPKYANAMYCGFGCQHATEVILVSNEANLRVDSNDSSLMCIPCNVKYFLHRSECENTIVIILLAADNEPSSIYLVLISYIIMQI